MKIAINKSCGGFCFSDEGYRWLIDEKGWIVTTYCYGRKLIDPDARIVRTNNYGLQFITEDERKLRIDSDIIEAIELLGPKVNYIADRMRISNIEIVEIPDGVEWEISEFEGKEHIAEKHRTWGDE